MFTGSLRQLIICVKESECCVLFQILKRNPAFVLKDEESFIMANKTTRLGLHIQENPDGDESCENIPPGGTVQARTSKLKRPREENKPLSDSCTFSTPAPTSNKQKSRLSFQSALTPILKYLNIGNKSPEPSTHENNHRLTAPLFSFGPDTADYQKLTKSSVQQSNSNVPSSYSGQIFRGMDSPVSFLGDECLPEMTLYDSTCDSMIQLTRNESPVPDSAPATTASTCLPESISEVHPPELSEHVATMDVTDLNAKMVDPSQSKHAPVPWLILDKFLPEITLLDVTHDSQSSPGEQEITMDVTQDLPPLDLKIVRPLSELSEKIVAEPSSSGIISGEKLLNTSMQSDRCVRENITKTDLEVTQDITMGSVLEKSSSEPSEHNMEKSQTSAEDTLGNNPANITREIISSSDMSAHSNIGCSTSPAKVTSELCEKNVASSDVVESNNEELVTSHETKSPSKPSSQNMEKSQTSAEDTLGSQPANITRDMTSSSDTSAQGVRFSTFNMECSNSPKKVTSELCEKPVASSDVVESNNEELVTSHETKSPSKPSGQNMEKSQTSAEDTLGSQPANITRDIMSSSDTSAQGVRFSTFNTECSTSLKTSTSESCRELVESSHKMKINNEDTNLKNNVPQPNPKEVESGNGTFNIVQAVNLSASSDSNAIASVSYPVNKALDLPPFNVNCCKDGSGAPDQASQNFSSVKECGPCHMQNTTFEKHSLQKSSGGTVLEEAAAAAVELKNNTFDSETSSKKSDTITLSETAPSESSQSASKPNSTVTLTEMSSCDSHQSASRPNGTLTLSETSSSDSHPRSSEKPTTPKVSNLTTNLTDNVDPNLSKHNVTADANDHNAKVVETHDDTSGAGSCELKDHSGVPVMGGLSDSLNRQSIGMVKNKADTFNLDDTLDLKADCLITSTPMTNCKILNFSTERNVGILPGLQKELYTDGPSKPADQMPSDAPSNLVCDRKTFLKQPPVKSLCPPSKAAAPLMKSNPLSSIPARLNTATSSLPMKRQRTQAEASRNTAAAACNAPHGTTGVTSFYNLRPTTTGSKVPSCGLQRPQLSGIPSGIQRATSGLRFSSARSSTAISSTADKLCGPAVTKPVARTSQATKHPLTRGETLSVSKRKKMDASMPSSNVEAPASACDAANKAKTLKQPSQRAVPAKTQREGCTKCAVLEEQLKMKSEENQRLKEELLKYTKQEDPVKSQC
ncbi:uncharacterized protein LOC115798573 isoform X2 [Archocentrus centrarchus]|uniref:uncharacterized protein LOC115798573 isoform X2 n=1 Tax=Archocentrus centrarchus TaxID=63155 RepID=UPI0011EA52A1|nr:uncharacterized protein LOC115798573 isoform X2 [Archocentrus centrarchus]